MLSRLLVYCLSTFGIPALAGSATAADLAGYYALTPIFGSKEHNTGEEEEVWRPREAAEPFIIALYPCGTGDFCGRVAATGWLGEVDDRNPVPAARGRKLCGLEVVRLKHPADARQRGALWIGKFYDPRRGDTGTLALSIDPDGNLTARSYSGTPVLSRGYVRGSVIFPRVTPDAATCERVQPAG